MIHATRLAALSKHIRWAVVTSFSQSNPQNRKSLLFYIVSITLSRSTTQLCFNSWLLPEIKSEREVSIRPRAGSAIAMLRRPCSIKEFLQFFPPTLNYIQTIVLVTSGQQDQHTAELGGRIGGRIDECEAYVTGASHFPPSSLFVFYFAWITSQLFLLNQFHPQLYQLHLIGIIPVCMLYWQIQREGIQIMISNGLLFV